MGLHLTTVGLLPVGLMGLVCMMGQVGREAMMDPRDLVDPVGISTKVGHHREKVMVGIEIFGTIVVNGFLIADGVEDRLKGTAGVVCGEGEDKYYVNSYMEYRKSFASNILILVENFIQSL